MPDPVIDNMTTRYRLAGDSQTRFQLARRLDRVVSSLLTDALNTLTQSDGSGDDDPVICIRKLRLSLWLDASRLDDRAAARHWADAIMQGVYKQQADGGSADVMRFPSENARLAAWISDMLEGVADQRWYWQDFAQEMTLPKGQAIAFVLGRNSKRIQSVFNLLSARGSIERMISSLSHVDVVSIWQAWAGEALRAGPIVPSQLIKRVGKVTAPPIDALSQAGRARTALAWLIELTHGPSALKIEVASGLAMQLGFVSILMAQSAPLRSLITGEAIDVHRLHALLDELPSDLDVAAQWLKEQTHAGGALVVVRSLALMALGVEDKHQKPLAAPVQKAERLRSAYAGTALLLHAIDALGLADRLGPVGRRDLLAAAIGSKYRMLARMDPVIRRLAGLPDNVRPELFPEPDWPSAIELGIEHAASDKDSQVSDDDLASAAVKACAREFAEGLRGMPGSSFGYLSEQFFHQPGQVWIERDVITVRLDGPPLGILLRMGGRVGEQPKPSWFEDRRFILETGNG